MVAWRGTEDYDLPGVQYKHFTPQILVPTFYVAVVFLFFFSSIPDMYRCIYIYAGDPVILGFLSVFFLMLFLYIYFCQYMGKPCGTSFAACIVWCFCYLFIFEYKDSRIFILSVHFSFVHLFWFFNLLPIFLLSFSFPVSFELSAGKTSNNW